MTPGPSLFLKSHCESGTSSFCAIASLTPNPHRMLRTGATGPAASNPTVESDIALRKSGILPMEHGDHFGDTGLFAAQNEAGLSESRDTQAGEAVRDRRSPSYKWYHSGKLTTMRHPEGASNRSICQEQAMYGSCSPRLL
jgi:hypothetical protein